MTHPFMLGHPARTLSVIGTPPTSQFFGVYYGSVVNTNDPLDQNRIQVLIPQVLGTAHSNWAVPLGDTTLSGSVVAGQAVFVFFIGGDRNLPAYTPATWPASQTTVTTPSIVFGTPVTNNFGVPVMVTVNGGTVTNITINNTATGLTSGSFILYAGGTILVTGSGASWHWFRAV